MSSRPTRIAIAGSGPAGSTLAALLAAKGADVTLFSGGKRPELVVGESVIPALIPIFRRLGIEEEVAAVSQLKPGATFVWETGNPIQLSFEAVQGLLPTYAYNVPRPQFDRIVENCARTSGARWIDAEAGIEKAASDGQREVQLGAETLAQVPEWKGEQPDLLVDATGRRRTVARLLSIPAKVGPRKDAAFFAHYEGWNHVGPPGQIIIGRTALGGWSWQIPLRDCVSVGVVLGNETARQLGSTPEERLEKAIDTDPTLAAAGKDRRRCTEAPVYSNYQLVSERGFGAGWVMAGDAFGFVDPMLSPGLWIAMRGGELLSDLVPKVAPSAEEWPRLLKRYEQGIFGMLSAWQELVAKFYDGSMMASYAAGQAIMAKYPGRVSNWFQGHVQRNFAGMACGIYTERRYSRALMGFLCKHTYGHQSADYAIA